MDWKSILGGVAPTLATALSVVGGPAGMVAGAALRAVSGAVLGHEDGTTDQVTQAIQAGLSPDAIAALQKADNDFKVAMAQISAATAQKEIEAASSAIGDVNETMQAEAKADHWPSYTWRPFIGFMFGLYVGSLFVLPLFHVQPVTLSADMTLTIAAVLGVASFFRGKAQADPRVQSDSRG
ncbi:3TM-type holin [Caballeronia sp. AZ7_KS35]|uniref:3TM-type holin n=1 Tax=Caballeronia sp. AZ7_KS35 TaxID=2921762 RepID=UPI0020287563|nr:3TM-type holin [Caballeronia sp. AZ7_KS35]